MKRIGALVVVTLLAVAGCDSSNTPAPARTTTKTLPSTSGPVTTPTGSPAVTGSATATPGDVIEFSVDGAGPYQLGTALAQLQTAGALAEVKVGSETCPDNTTARGVGTWSDIHLSFHKDGTLYLAVNRSISIPTPSGAWLGTTLAQLKKIYVSVTAQELKQGATHSGFLVTTLSGRGILFDLDSSSRVFSMAAGDAAFLKTGFTAGTDFC